MYFNEKITNEFLEKFNLWLEKQIDFYTGEYLAENGKTDGDLNIDCGGPFWTEQSLELTNEYTQNKIQEEVDYVEFCDLMEI